MAELRRLAVELKRPGRFAIARTSIIVSLSLGALAAIWFVLREVDERQFQRELLQARTEFGTRQFATARARLARLAQRRPREGEVDYLLGICEKLRGHTDDAMAAWRRVPDHSNHAPLAALARGRLALEIGRFSTAEESLIRASREAGEVADEAGRLLEWLYWMTGRRDDNQAILRKRAASLADPSLTLRKLWSVDQDPYPVDGITTALANAAKLAPDDDRVWLGLADLATRSGRFDEARAWLGRCEHARPGDLAVWNAQLRWARAAGRAGELRQIAASQPHAQALPAITLALRAWLEEQNGDASAERSSLEALLAIDPANDAALERSAELASQAGDLKTAGEIRRRKAAIDLARDRYRGLINLTDLAPCAADLARAAEAIGRWFDAKTWWALAARRDLRLGPQASTAIGRLAELERQCQAGGPPLAQVVAQVRLKTTALRSQPAEPSIPSFVDEAEERGLAFSFQNGQSGLRQLPETMSGGVALFDFDRDGWLDVYAIQGGPFPPPRSKPPFGDRLFKNRGDGRFDDVTASSGLAACDGGYGHGAAVGDYDNDGRPDLFVTRFRSYALYHNLGGGRFEDVTARAGLAGDRDWPTSAAWADLDGDGDLDLYVCHYVEWDAEHPTLCEYAERSKPGYTYCDPRGLRPLPDHVFRNDSGRFVDVTAQARFVDREGRGLGVIAADFDRDGKTDVFVANDTTANGLYRNLGNFQFTEQGIEAGLAASAQGGYLAGMGIACGDFDGDGRPDLAVTNFFNESTTLYHNHGEGIFSDRSANTGLAALTRHYLGFGLAALDANNDGWCDLVQANGHVTDYRPTIPWAMNAQLLLGTKTGRFLDVSSRAGAPWQTLRLGRGLASGDIDNDGWVDVVIVSQNAPLALLHNQTAATAESAFGSHCHYLVLELEGTASNRDAVGAVVAVTAAGRTQVKLRFGGGSYLSASDDRLHFGLGAATTADRIEVAWPSGRHDRFEGVAADSGYRLRETSASPVALSGFGSRRSARPP